MSAVTMIASWVHKKPIILIRLNGELSESLRNSFKGFEHLTIAKRHSVFDSFKIPTICLLETTSVISAFSVEPEPIEKECYLGVITSKTAVSTFDSRLTIKKLRRISPSSFEQIESMVTVTRMKNLLRERMPDEDGFAQLTPKLSSDIVEIIAEESENLQPLETALSLLPRLRKIPNGEWAQEDAIHSAMAVLGIGSNEIPDNLTLKRGSFSGLRMLGAHLYEDNVVHSDASSLPGFDSIGPDVTGRAIFTKGDEQLVIYTANKLPLEQMLGVDLIYINETRGNVVMVQYKMLEEIKQQDGDTDWIFRPDKQLNDEIGRMKLPVITEELSDYRLNRKPFFFKFVKRKVVDDSPQSFIVSLEHLKKILADPVAKGPKGGIRLSYNTLNGTYLRKADMINLIRSGYVGTHRSETKVLKIIIETVAKGDKAIVFAWQKKLK